MPGTFRHSGAWLATISLLLFLGSTHALQQASGTHQQSTWPISGRLIWPADVARSANTRLQLRLDGGKTDITWPKASGAFTFLNVPEGSHLLDVVAIDVLYPQLRVDVSGGDEPEVAVALANNMLQVIPAPLVIHPLGRAQYYEQRQPFDIMSFVKSPYGLMIVFGLFTVVVLPMLKMDEEPPEAAAEATPAVTGSQPAAIRGSPAGKRR